MQGDSDRLYSGFSAKGDEMVFSEKEKEIAMVKDYIVNYFFGNVGTLRYSNTRLIRNKNRFVYERGLLISTRHNWGQE